MATDSTHAAESDGSPEAVGDTEETAERENGEKGGEGDDDLPVSLISSSTSPEVVLGSPATDAQVRLIMWQLYPQFQDCLSVVMQ